MILRGGGGEPVNESRDVLYDTSIHCYAMHPPV